MSIAIRFTCHWYGAFGWQPVTWFRPIRWVH